MMIMEEEALRCRLVRRVVSMPAEDLHAVSGFIEQLGHRADQAEAEREDWISLDEAAGLLGRSAGHLRRLCISTLLANGVAHLVKPAGGGKPQWFLDRRYDPRLIRA